MPDESSTPPPEKSSSSMWIIVAGIFLVPVALIVGLFLVFSSSGNSSKPPQPIDPTSAANVQLITQLNNFVDPAKSIGDQIDSVFSLGSTLTDVLTALGKNTTAPADKKANLEASLNEANSYLIQIEADAQKIKSSTTDATALQQEAFAQQQLRSLEPELQRKLLTLDSPYTGTASEAIKIAQDLIAKNNNGSKLGDSYVIPYRVGGSSDNQNGTDSSGFLMQIWEKLGITLPGLHVNNGFIANLPGFISIKRTDGTDVTNTNLVDSVKIGDVRPGDVIISGNTDTVTNCLSDTSIQCHSVLYLGPSFDSQSNIGEATKGVNTSGPQFTTLESRAKYGSTVLAVLRAPYAQ